MRSTDVHINTQYTILNQNYNAKAYFVASFNRLVLRLRHAGPSMLLYASTISFSSSCSKALVIYSRFIISVSLRQSNCRLFLFVGHQGPRENRFPGTMYTGMLTSVSFFINDSTICFYFFSILTLKCLHLKAHNTYIDNNLSACVFKHT